MYLCGIEFRYMFHFLLQCLPSIIVREQSGQSALSLAQPDLPEPFELSYDFMHLLTAYSLRSHFPALEQQTYGLSW